LHRGQSFSPPPAGKDLLSLGRSLPPRAAGRRSSGTAGGVPAGGAGKKRREGPSGRRAAGLRPHCRRWRPSAQLRGSRERSGCACADKITTAENGALWPVPGERLAPPASGRPARERARLSLRSACQSCAGFCAGSRSRRAALRRFVAELISPWGYSRSRIVRTCGRYGFFVFR